MAANPTTRTRTHAPDRNGVETPRTNGKRPRRATKSSPARRNGASAAPLSLAENGSVSASTPEPHPDLESLAQLAKPAGGRLTHRSVWVLKVIAAEPGLGNREVGERVGVFDQSHAGEVIRRLSRLGLIVNTQPGRVPQGNAWRLTLAGEELDRATPGEDAVGTPVQAGPVGWPPGRRGTLESFGSVTGRAEPAVAGLDRRGVSILKIIGAEPGLGNREVGERAGVASVAQTAELLRRLRLRELVVNTQPGRDPKANAWQLTSAGEQLIAGTGGENGAAPMRDAGPAVSSGAPEPAASANGALDRRRERIVAGVVRVAFAEGVGEVSVERVARCARVSEEAFYECFEDRDAALLAAFDDALARAGERTRRAVEAEEGWLERVRLGLLVLLEFFDEEPALAMLLVVGSAEGRPVLRARRAQVLAGLAALLDDEPTVSRAYPPRLSAEAVVNGVLGVVHPRLCERRAPLIELSQQLMAFVVTPFLGTAAARRELRRPAVMGREVAARKAAQELLHGYSGRGMRHPLASRVLHVIRAQPGLSNSQVAERTRVGNDGQMSKTLSRLRRLGLIENRCDTKSRPGLASIWHLTSSGEAVESALRYEVTEAIRKRATTNVAVSQTATAAVSEC